MKSVRSLVIRVYPFAVALAVCMLWLSACNSESSSSGTASCTPGQAVCNPDGISYVRCNDDGNWSDSISCGENEECLAGQCIPIEVTCTPGETACTLDMLATCNADGKWEDPEMCPTDTTCIVDPVNGDYCGVEDPTDKICRSGEEKRCSPESGVEAVQICNELGLGWEAFETCAANYFCNVNTCIPENTPICEPLEDWRCDQDGIPVRCNSEGTKYEYPSGTAQPCDSEEHCIDGRCVVGQVCEPGTETRCVSQQVCNDGECEERSLIQICTADGLDWSNPIECPGTQECEEGRCREVSCNPDGDFRCVGTTMIQYCLASGDGYGEAESCPNGEVCDRLNGCGSSNYVCLPGEKRCVTDDPHLIEECNEDGTGWLAERITCEDDPNDPDNAVGLSCIDGKCLTLCEQKERRRSYIGCEYFPVVLPNTVSDVFKQGNESEYAVVVSNTEADYTAHITIEGPNNFRRLVDVDPLSDETIRLPYYEVTSGAADDEYNVGETTRSNNSFHLVSSTPVTVYQFNPLTALTSGTYAYTNDASLLLPRHVLGNHYLAMTYGSRFDEVQESGSAAWYLGSPDFVTIVATEPGTTEVKIWPSAHTSPSVNVNPTIPMMSPRTNPYVYSLSEGEVLQISSSMNSTYIDQETCILVTDTTAQYPRTGQYCKGPDLTGTEIQSDQRVAVYSGNRCAFVPHYRWACDHLEQQMFPTNSWAMQYIAANINPPDLTQPAIFKVLALEDDTTFRTNPERALEQESPYSNSPCWDSETQRPKTLNKGESCMIEATAIQDFALIADAGKPVLLGQFMVGQNYDPTNLFTSYGDPAFFLIPPIEQYRSDYIFLAPRSYEKDKINIYSTSNDVTIELDGQPLDVQWQQIGDLNAYVFRTDVTDGSHQLKAQGKVGLIVYGYDRYVSYGYPAGLDLSYLPY